MKLHVKFEKLSSGKIECRLRVIDPEDYPSGQIFESTHDYPSDKGFTLRSDGWSFIEYEASTYEEALEWVEREISALRCHLKKWREIEIPEGIIYII